MQTLTMLATICYQIARYEEFISNNLPPGWDEWNQSMAKWELYKRGKAPREPQFEPMRPTMILW